MFFRRKKKPAVLLNLADQKMWYYVRRWSQ